MGHGVRRADFEFSVLRVPKASPFSRYFAIIDRESDIPLARRTRQTEFTGDVRKETRSSPRGNRPIDEFQVRRISTGLIRSFPKLYFIPRSTRVSRKYLHIPIARKIKVAVHSFLVRSASFSFVAALLSGTASSQGTRSGLIRIP